VGLDAPRAAKSERAAVLISEWNGSFCAIATDSGLSNFGHQPFHPERGGASIITWPTVARR
jgi:hypothetical protein